MLPHKSRLRQPRVAAIHVVWIGRKTAREICLLQLDQQLGHVHTHMYTRMLSHEPLRNHYRQWRATDGHRARTMSSVGSDVVSQPPRAHREAASLTSASPGFILCPSLSLLVPVSPFGRLIQKKEGTPCRLHNRPTPAGQPLDPDRVDARFACKDPTYVTRPQVSDQRGLKKKRCPAGRYRHNSPLTDWTGVKRGSRSRWRVKNLRGARRENRRA